MPGQDETLAIADHDLDHVAVLAASFFGMSTAVVLTNKDNVPEIVARHGQVVDASQLEIALCTLAADNSVPLVIEDVAADPRFTAYVTGAALHNIRSCLGARLRSQSGVIFGALCLFGKSPRSFSVDEVGHLHRFVKIAMDRLNLEATNRNLIVSQQRFMSMCRTLPTALVCSDAEGSITYFNPKASAMFGYAEYEILGKSVKTLIPESFHEDYDQRMRHRVQMESGERIGELKDTFARRRDGREFPVRVGLSRWDDSSGPRFGAAFIDVTHSMQREAQLEHLAHYDHLTELPNRRWFFELAGRRLEGRPGAELILIDLDGFKDFNDRLGHAMGDRLLRAVSDRIQPERSEECLFARLGGDEFVCLLLGQNGVLDAVRIAKELREKIAKPYLIEGHILQIGASVGVAISPDHGSSLAELLANADLALYASKSDGGGRVRLFQPHMKQRAEARRTIQADLARGFASDEFELYFQPQVRLADRSVWGVEVLLRWRHPEHGLLAPGAFLPLLNEMLLASDVGHWVLESAISQASRWRGMGLPRLQVGVNLFTAQFRARRLVTSVFAALDKYNFPPDCLELEILETVAVGNIDTVVADLQALKERGVKIAFDDFGTGYASLSTLKQFPVTTLKIDQSFVREFAAKPEDAALVEAVIKLGETFNLTVIAEGVETEAQETKLIQEGCLIGQGYFYGKPMPAPEFETYLTRNAQTALALRKASGERT
jgi:diguanylate cyclase (GGDEF)-like protein/PAS domain S-box-containing protein